MTDLLRELRQTHPTLAQDLEREVAVLADRRAFGLNFERHVPEAVDLPGRKVRKRDKVRILPPRGQAPSKANATLWRVAALDRQSGTAALQTLAAPARDFEYADSNSERQSNETVEAAVEDLVVVAEFRDPIYPGLVSTGKVERGGKKPFNTIINSENFHALETLLFTHRGRVDCIYIDPPYNTGAKDWKYNNDYVEGDDLYRHSKWLAMMERRLLLARELLNPEDSALIVTIDEKEYLRLGLLLEQTYPDARIQMVSSVINPKGVPRDGLSRVDEYLFFVQFGASQVEGEVQEGSGGKEVRWRGLTRTGANGVRSKSPGAFYPIFFSADGKIVDVGDALPLDQSADSVTPPSGLIAVWPTPRPDGEDGRWSVVPDTLRRLIEKGAVRVGRVNVEKGQFPIFYLTSNQLKAIEAGELEVRGRTESGQMIVHYRDEGGRVSAPRTVWDNVSHSASEHGSMLLRSLLPGRKFPFPKSLYAVEDALRLFVGKKRTATVLDFFAGSGTTAHAVMRLNKQDGGERTSIVVTNNEVAADEQKTLRSKGLRPGDADWEQLGICEHITKPRIESAITGKTPDGRPIKGEYKFTDEFPIAKGLEENVEFFTLTYEAPLRVASHREFSKISPLLWIRAGSRGRRIEDISAGWDVADSYGILADLDQADSFVERIASSDHVKIAFIVTDEERLFESVAQELPNHVEPVRLYEAYLRNFEIESGRGSL
ncbi:MAG TPA: DNA methyltransferase [Woeseiaceae bacterium]|nr:DNA methyltransferase [Woeseiaceae bacterium]